MPGKLTSWHQRGWAAGARACDPDVIINIIRVSGSLGVWSSEARAE